MRRAEETEGSSTIEVKVVQLGSPTVLVTLPEGAGKAEALRAAGYDENSVVKVNGEEMGDEDILEDGDRLTIGAKVKGN